MDPHFREAQRRNICRSTTTRHSLRLRLELVKGRFLEGPGGLNWTEYCICDSMLPIAVKGKADTVSMETEDGTPLGLRLEGPLKRAESTGQPISETRGDSGGERDATLWLVGAETPLYAAWLGVYSWQLLRDVVGLVGRRDSAG